MPSMSSFLVIGPHPDDQELGMGGTIARLIEQGHRVHLVDMTSGEPTPLGSPEIRQRESAAAAKILGVQRTQLGLVNREVTHDLASRHKLAAVIRVHKPDVLFLPYPVDAHPDHVAVTKIGEDARFDAKLTKSDIPGEPWHPRRIIYYFCTHLRLLISAHILHRHQRAARKEDGGRDGVRIAACLEPQPGSGDGENHQRIFRKPDQRRAR